MEQYISKSAVIAEIERRRKIHIERDEFDDGANYVLDKILSFLDTLEATEVYDTSAPTVNSRWRILKEKEAEKYHIQLIKIGDDKALLSIDLAYIPQNMSIVEYLNWLRETGVILNFTPKTTRS